MVLRISEAIDALPTDSHYRALLRAIGSKEPAVVAAGKKARAVVVRPYWEPPYVCDSATALIVLNALLDLQSADRGVAEVLFSLIGSPHPEVRDTIVHRFAAAPRELRLDLLTIIASAGTRAGATALVELVTAHGWPEQFHQRFRLELKKNAAHADVFFPAILSVDGAPDVIVGDFLLDCLRRGLLAPERIANTHLARELPLRIKALSAKLPDDSAARELAVALDLAGFVGDLTPALREAATLEQTWPAAFAVAALVRRGELVAPESIERIAKDDSRRNAMFCLLRDLGRADLFPPHFATRDHFARADMVAWLAHQGELGHSPPAIELMKVFEEHDAVLYVWRFKAEANGKWLASIGGPYKKDSPPGPLSGPSTFSRFEPWD